MAQKWYEKAAVQGAIVGGTFLLLATIAAPLIQRGLFKKEIKSKSEPKNVKTDSTNIVLGASNEGEIDTQSTLVEINHYTPQINIETKVDLIKKRTSLLAIKSEGWMRIS